MIKRIYRLELIIKNDKAWGNKDRIIGYYTSKDIAIARIIEQMKYEQHFSYKYKIEYEIESNCDKPYVDYEVKYTDKETNELIETRNYIIETIPVNRELTDMNTM